MTDRQKAIAAAKEAYRLYFTHAIHTTGFSYTGDDDQRPYRFAGHRWVVYLKTNGSLSWAYRATEPEDFQ